MSNIKEFISSIRVIDGHEHVNTFSFRQKNQVDLFGLLHYLESDLFTAGMPRDAITSLSSADVEEKAIIFKKYFERTQNTAYAKAFKTAMKDLYQMEYWSVKGILELNDKVLQASNDSTWYNTVLSEKSGIDLVLTLVGETMFDDPSFRSVMFLDYYFEVLSIEKIHEIEKKVGKSISTLSHYITSLQDIMDSYVLDGVVATKLGYAYRRTLDVGKPTFYEAEKVFNEIMRLQLKQSLSQEETKPLQDYLIHEVIRASIERNLPIQIHTGHHETTVSGNGNIITNSKVTDLIPLLLEYKEAKFVLLHSGLPYVDEYIAIAKNFPNVYADMTWVYIISPTIASHALHKMIEMVPWSKIQGFGGDYNYVEGIYAHMKLARQVLGNVLEEKIKAGYLTEKEAQQFAEGVLRYNLFEIYNLSK